MNPRIPIQRLRRSVQSLPEEFTISRPPQPPIPETADLAKELAQAYLDELEKHRRSRNTSSPHPDPDLPPSQQSLDDLFSLPPEATTFFHLERMLRADPERALKRWEAVKEAAREAVENGSRAALALEFLGGSAAERAEFLALRSQLRDAWPPQHAAETLLIDEMAQYLFLRQKWIAVLAMHSREPALPSRRCRSEQEPRRATAVEATNEAIRMTERLQRLFLSALRMLLKLRGPKKSERRPDWLHALLCPPKASS